MGALMRATDWTTSSLGPPEEWSQPLRTAVRILLNTGHPMYIFWGPELACLYNDAYSRSIGPERHPVSLGRPGREVWSEIWDIIGPQIDKVMSGRGATWHVNHLVPITRHGRREDVYWTYSYSPIDDDSAPSGVGGVLVVCTETTAQVVATRQLTAERDRLAQLFEQAPTFMALLQGPQHVFELCNPAYARIVDNRPLIGRPLAEALPEAVEQGFVALLDHVFRTGQAYSAAGARYIQKSADGHLTERFVDFVYQPIAGADGQVTGIFVQGADVTDRTNAEAALKVSEQRHRELASQVAEALASEREARAAADRANRTKDEFLAMLGHELRNPLAPILTALELMRFRGDGGMMRERAVIERQVTHLHRLIDDLLDVSRVTSGKIELKPERVELADVVARAVELVSPAMEGRQQKLTTAVPPRGMAVRGDRTRIVQILSNLLTNASRYGRTGGSIDIRASHEGSHLSLSVADDGRGISPELLPRIFDLFTQAERRPDRAEGGLGLGLAIVRSLVALHGGSVDAVSDGPDKGSTFTVRLPADTSESAAVDEVASSSAGDDLERPTARRILVVDDNRDAADLLADTLNLLGHSVRTAYDGPSALDAARAFAPELALVDIGLPVMDGYEVARRLRRIDGLRHVQIVAVTGYGQNADRTASADAGFDDHLVKPIAADQLTAVVDRLSAPSQRR
jgi:PAS domain S-box-containing protein